MSKNKLREMKEEWELASQQEIDRVNALGISPASDRWSRYMIMQVKGQMNTIRDLSSDDCIELATLLENEDEEIRDYFFKLNPNIKRCYEMKAFV